MLAAGTHGGAGTRTTDGARSAGGSQVADNAQGAGGAQATVGVCECAAEGGCHPI
jgi:hypothetical protein